MRTQNRHTRTLMETDIVSANVEIVDVTKTANVEIVDVTKTANERI